ncbi:MAG: SRPBCC domain-containing protein [Novosphingobium sp.]|nr:SRPBCC domain-containing protein [Novosphingobium sp.]MCP5404201.1 SRPBCC domain-containing protein [Novosphingobium sp.]
MTGVGGARAAGLRHCAEDSVEIEAPVETVWKLLVDFAGWQDWNPLYVETRGDLRVGSAIGFTVALAGMKPHGGSATVLSVIPNEVIEYGTGAFAGLVRATRYIEVRALGAERCLVVNGEHMGGLLGPLLFKAVGEKVRLGLKGMNEALKGLAEQHS